MFARTPSAKFFRLALFATCFAYGVVLLGAYTRYAESNLGCPDWPGCFGRLFAPITPQDLEEAKALYPEHAVEPHKAWQEMAHRYISGVLGLLAFRLGWLGWRLRRNGGYLRSLNATLVVALVVLQALLGMLSFAMAAKPLLVMSHLFVGMTTLALLWWIVLREQRFWRPINTTVTRSLRPRVLAALFLIAAEIGLGGWSSANHTALVCPDFPTCRGEWWPEGDYIAAFTSWRDLGLDYRGEMLSMSAATAIHVAHRVGALIVFLYVAWLALRVVRIGGDSGLCRYGVLILVLLLAQTAVGIMSVVLHLPVVLSVAHNGMAALLLMGMVTLHHVVRPRLNGKNA